MDPQFPIQARCLWANHAAISPWPLAVADAVQAFAVENSQLGALGYRGWMERETALRGKTAEFLNATNGNDIGFLKNTTEGISMVAWGVPLDPGDNIVIPKGEFPSNRLPWLAQSERGAQLREVDIRGADDPEIALLDAMDARTRLLSVSAVQWSDGFRLNLERLGPECRNRGVLFFVDAIQQLGALPLDVEASAIDCLCADAHKWLLGPEGIAIFYANERTRELLSLTQRGWHATDNPFDFGNPDQPVSDTARRFEAGSPNSMGQAALEASLGLLMDQGMQSVGEAVLANTEQLIRGLGDLPGIEISSRTEPGRRSGIVAFQPTELELPVVFRGLKKHNVVAALRGPAIRLSPHFYQAGESIDRIIEAVASAVKA